MLGIEETRVRIRRYCDEQKMRANAVLTAAANIVVQALVDEINRSLQKQGALIARLDERLTRLEARLDGQAQAP